MRIDLDDIVQSPHQTRRIREDEELRELAESIQDNGLLQPIKVRPTEQGYELVYGHRRVAAMRLLGWTRCEAVVEDVEDHDSLVQSLIENLQREDLDVLEEARSYRRLSQRGYTLREISELVRKPQGRISNRLSILRLPPEVRRVVRPARRQHQTTTEQGSLSLDSASRISSAATTSSEAKALARKAIKEELSSRQVRELTRLLNDKTDPRQRQQVIRQPWQATERALSRVQSDNKSSQTSTASYKSFSSLVQRKIMWNLKRLNVEALDHFTIGYSKRTLAQFIELLHAAKVDLLADVRDLPLSRFRPEFSQSNLRNTLIRHGVGYQHWPELGVPSQVRQRFQDAVDLVGLFNWYDSNVQPGVKLAEHCVELKSKRVAFMCVEFDPQSCHRHRIAISLEQEGYMVLDL